MTMAKKDNKKYINNTKTSCKPKESQSTNTSSRKGLIIGTAVTFGVGAVLAAPFAIAAAGFGTVGIAAGSLGASMMSWAATHGFGMAVVSALQSAGAAGIGLSANALIGFTGAAVGVGVGAAADAAVEGNAGDGGDRAVNHSDESDDEDEDDMPSSALRPKKS